ncbi:cation acetate symporter [Microaerobacter geothermalis]|uniref:solute symporter family protein n=1 Tax=Microaerobacter geothermalis TaxID=674972 RepID=UPI001F17A398|nr:cation acetate symporter [Microaerobacter geothermalis]MCF6094978.1 cation acetate symporter [Microaerobacter geothermalis]
MNLTYFIFFLFILAGTLIITYWAAKRGTTTHQFYSVSASLTGFQNGLAIAGDYMSAASFLGITGAIALKGFDGFFYSIGFLVSYLVLLLVIAEPIRHLGSFTLGDVIFARFPIQKMRLITSLSTIIISILYIIPQLVAAGLLIQLLLGIEYGTAVFIIGSLMTIYVVFGGMIATSWVQIVKTVLLMSGTFLISLIVLSRFDWNFFSLMEYVSKGTPFGEQFFYPGNLFLNPMETLSLNLTLILGTAGLPHILIRFFTVKDALAVRKSVITATWIIGLFYLMTLILGFGAVAFVGWEVLVSIDPTGNLAAPLLAAVLGGDFLMAFISAIAFATILAVVTGLVISATSSFAHDIYNHYLCRGEASEQKQLRVAKLTATFIGLFSILLSMGLKNINVTFLVSLTFVVAASTHLPLLLFTLYWRRFNSTGAITGIVTGLAAAVILVLLGPYILMIIPLYNPGIIAIPLGFLGAVLGTVFSKQAIDEETFIKILVQSQTGLK